MAPTENPWNCNNFRPSWWRPHCSFPRRQARITAGYTYSTWNAFYNVPPQSDIRQVAIKADYYATSTKWHLFPSTEHVIMFRWPGPITFEKDDASKKRNVFTAYSFVLLHKTHNVPGQVGNQRQSNHWGDQYCGICAHMQHENKTDCNLNISEGLKSNAITDEPKKWLCPFQEDWLVKLDYIS